MLAHREFNFSDQKRFASVSGDHNPMHMDALQARRTQAGAPIVHGIHLLLWALDSLSAARPGMAAMRSLRAQFTSFVHLGDCVEVVVTKETPASVRLNISVNNIARGKVVVGFGDALSDSPEWIAAPLKEIPLSATALDPTFQQMADCSGSLPCLMTAQDAKAMFPSAAKWLGVGKIAALAASTQLVGMVCPGLHSIYSELSVESSANGGPKAMLAFRTTGTDARFRSVKQEIAGAGLVGTAKSFARMPPVEQAAMASLAGLVAPQEFAGSVALIVGGSRGLGELTAKLIATGGGHVVITWHSGKDDAEKVAQEIRSAGKVCTTLAYDACRPAAEQLGSLGDTPTHAYYFATPHIFRPQGEIYMEERLSEFQAVYVDGFWKLAQALRMRQPRLSLFYPSSVSVTERPRGMTEYTMAKAAAEVLCADMNASLAPLRVTVSRLPRLPTDQTSATVTSTIMTSSIMTSTVKQTEIALPIETLLPIVREVQSWPR